jgi:hypothetical protein
VSDLDLDEVERRFDALEAALGDKLVDRDPAKLYALERIVLHTEDFQGFPKRDPERLKALREQLAERYR